MVLGLLGRLSDLSDEELNTLALAIGTELARRANPDATGTEPAAEPEAPAPPAPVYVTLYGRCWHRQRSCGHLRRSKTVREVPHPWEADVAVTSRRPCKDCTPAAQEPAVPPGPPAGPALATA